MSGTDMALEKMCRCAADVFVNMVDNLLWHCNEQLTIIYQIFKPVILMGLIFLFNTGPHELWDYKSKCTLLCVAILSGQISKMFIHILQKR